MKKKILSLILAVSMLCTFMPVITSAAIVDSGTCGENVTWTLDDNGTLTISGTGDMTDYDLNGNSYAPWFDNRSGIYAVIIENGVTSIGDYTFYGCALTSVNIPASVTSIGRSAFSYCGPLTSITIPDSVTTIGNNAFAFSGQLTNVTIGKRVTSIGDGAFSYCGLTSVTIPDGVTSIGYGAFTFNPDLTSATIPDSVTSIGDWAFSECMSLTSITIPRGVTSIGEGTFDSCISLTDVYYGGSEADWAKVYIGEENDSLKNATIHYSNVAPTPTPVPTPKPTPLPMTTAEIERTDDEADAEYTFEIDAADKYENCYVYAAIYDVNGALIELSRVPLEQADKTSISVRKSPYNALLKLFIWSDNMQPVIEAKELPLIPTVVIVDSGICGENVTWTLDSNGTLTISGTGDMAYYNYDSPFFSNDNIKSVVIEDGVTSVGQQAFYDCSNLTSIIIPDSVTSIDWEAFLYCSGLTSINIPDSVTYIGNYAFYECSGLTSITIPDSITSIGYCVFGECTSLTSITIPDSVTSIGNSAFSGCSSLTSITIPDSVTSIGWDAFGVCDNLTDVYYTGTETQWNAISIGDYNEALTNATIHYNSL